QGIVKILTATPAAISLADMVAEAHRRFGERAAADAAWQGAVFDFVKEREAHLFERRGFKADEARAVLPFWDRPASALKRVEALSQARKSKEFETLAIVFKRVTNILKDFDSRGTLDLTNRLTE